MSTFFSGLLLLLGLAHVVCGGRIIQDEDTQNLLNERCAQDIGVLLEDMKTLLYYFEHRDTSPSPTPSSFLAQDCQDVRHVGDKTVSGLATVYLPDPNFPTSPPADATVYCDQATARGGWLLLMRRSDGSEDFPNRLYNEYSRGFGNVAGSSFWLGLESIYRLTRYQGRKRPR